MDLYTSLTQLKMAMNGGTLPPMTPLTDRAAAVLDPQFSIGMGGFIEDAERGLRCPVRGCGVWRHKMTHHLNASHKGIGGATGVKSILSIPRSVKLVSQTLRSKKRAIAAKMIADGKLHAGGDGSSFTRHGTMRERTQRAVATARDSRASTGYRNLRDTCEAQLKHRFIDLHNKIGRSPSLNEFADEYGVAITDQIRVLYGTWNNAKTHFGFETYQAARGSRRSRLTGVKLDSAQLIASLRAWHDAHGELPTATAVESRRATPLLHSPQCYLKAMGTNSWPEAMRRAAALLNIYGGRFGLPEPVRSREVA